MKHIQPITSSDFFSLLNNKPAIDSAPLRALESKLAAIERDAVKAMVTEPLPKALPAPDFFPVPAACCRPDGTLRDLMPNIIEWCHANEPTFARLD